jgi:hypothetical protein
VRAPLEMLLTMTVSPFTRGCQQCLPLTILVRHHWPAMMIDLTGSEKTALNPLWSAP